MRNFEGRAALRRDVASCRALPAGRSRKSAGMFLTELLSELQKACIKEAFLRNALHPLPGILLERLSARQHTRRLEEKSSIQHAGRCRFRLTTSMGIRLSLCSLDVFALGVMGHRSD